MLAFNSHRPPLDQLVPYTRFDSSSPEYPEERLAFMLKDTAAPILLTQTRFQQKLPPHGVTILCLDNDQCAFAKHPDSDLPRLAQPTNLVYCIYTSGSTGQPKGALNTHRSVVNLLCWYFSKTLRTLCDERVLLASSLSFDLTQKNILGPLAFGKTIVVPEGATTDFDRIVRALKQGGATRFNCAPSIYRALGSGALTDSITSIVLGGESIDHEIATEIARHNIWLVNSYGPTECADVAIAFSNAPESRLIRIPLGRPLPNVRAYVLDIGLQPVPIGVIGQIHIAGVGVGRGYLNRPHLTAEKFIPDPYGLPGTRMYATGDLGFFMPDGNVVFAGRADHQIKLRGIRIELGEIENVLLAHPDVSSAVVALVRKIGKEETLTGFIIVRPQQTISIDNLTNWLRRQLPPYMVPTLWAVMHAFPLSLNGKVDRAALSSMQVGFAVTDEKYEGPRGSTEKAMAEIWKRVLGLDAVSINDNFFAIGGHSLLAVQMARQVNDTLGLDLSIRSLFENPTIHLLSKYIASPATLSCSTQRPAPFALQSSEDNEFPVSYAQERTIRSSSNACADVSYHVAITLEMFGSTNTPSLKRAIDCVVRQHRALRTQFVRETRSDWLRQVICTDPVEFHAFDFRQMPGKEAERAFHRTGVGLIRRPFDIFQRPPVRFGLFELADDRFALVCVFHHLVFDGASESIFLRDFEQAYHTVVSGGGEDGDLPTFSFGEYALAQRRWCDTRDASYRASLEAWQKMLNEPPPRLRLNFYPPAVAMPTEFVSAAVTRALRGIPASARAEFCVAHAVSAFALYVAAFHLSLIAVGSEDDVVIGSPYSGRVSSDVDRMIGPLSDTQLIRVRAAITETVSEYVARLRETLIEVSENEHMPLPRLMSELQPLVGMAYRPIYNVRLAYQTYETYEPQLPNLNVDRLALFPHSGSSTRDLSLYIIHPARATLHLQYNALLFSNERAEAFLDVFESIGSLLSAAPSQMRIQEILERAATRRR